MTRFVPVTVLVLLAASRVATADSGSLPNGATLKFDKIYIHEDGNKDLVEPKDLQESLWNYFNLAHCQCGKTPPQGFVETEFAYLLTLQSTGTINPDRSLEIWVGSQCDTTDVTTRNAMCHRIVPPNSDVDATVPSIAGMQQTNGATVK